MRAPLANSSSETEPHEEDSRNFDTFGFETWDSVDHTAWQNSATIQAHMGHLEPAQYKAFTLWVTWNQLTARLVTRHLTLWDSLFLRQRQLRTDTLTLLRLTRTVARSAPVLDVCANHLKTSSRSLATPDSVFPTGVFEVLWGAN